MVRDARDQLTAWSNVRTLVVVGGIFLHMECSHGQDDLSPELNFDRPEMGTTFGVERSRFYCSSGGVSLLQRMFAASSAPGITMLC